MAKSTSKYAHVLPGLPRLATSEGMLSSRDKVEAVKQGLAPLGSLDLTAYYIGLRRQKAALMAQVKELNVSIEACRQLLVDSQMAKAPGWGEYGVADNAIRLATGDILRVQPKPHAKILDAEAFRLWCLKAGYERDMKLHPGKANSVVKERLVAGVELPDGVDVYRWDALSLTAVGGPIEDGGEDE